MTPDPAHAMTLAQGADGARDVFAYCLDGLRAQVGSKLTTASVYDVAKMRSRRVWTDDPAAYPAGNFKRLDRNLYFERVIEGRRPFHSRTIEEIAEVFFDWEKIESLGFRSNMNLPAIANGVVVGTVNLLDVEEHYTPERVAAAMAWQPVATLAFLLLHASPFANFHGAPGDGEGDMEG